MRSPSFKKFFVAHGLPLRSACDKYDKAQALVLPSVLNGDSAKKSRFNAEAQADFFAQGEAVKKAAEAFNKAAAEFLAKQKGGK